MRHAASKKTRSASSPIRYPSSSSGESGGRAPNCMLRLIAPPNPECISDWIVPHLHFLERGVLVAVGGEPLICMQVYIIMRQIITLAIFFMCLFSCAGLVLFFIWAGGPPGERWMQTAATLF